VKEIDRGEAIFAGGAATARLDQGGLHIYLIARVPISAKFVRLITSSVPEVQLSTFARYEYYRIRPYPAARRRRASAAGDRVAVRRAYC
jgi:hypothetical protein